MIIFIILCRTFQQLLPFLIPSLFWWFPLKRRRLPHYFPPKCAFQFDLTFHIGLNRDVLNSASRILQCWSYYVNINPARHQHDTERTPIKTEWDCSHRQLFRPFWGSSVWRNNQRKLWWKISAHPDFKHCSILLAEFNMSTFIIFADQVFVDPAFFGIFVCGPLQSFMVNASGEETRSMTTRPHPKNNRGAFSFLPVQHSENLRGPFLEVPGNILGLQRYY